MRKSNDDSVKRRDFLKAAAAGTAAAAALAANPVASRAASAAPDAPHGNATAPTLAKPPLADAASHVDVVTVDRPGSDFMVDVIKSLDFEYLCANPGIQLPRSARIADQLRRQQELRNSSPAATRNPSVAMAHGYAKIEGKPLLVCAHGTVGLQHASMAIYNAYCDRVPVYMILGNIRRRGDAFGQVDWTHSVQDRRGDGARFREVGRSARSRCKHFAESAVRAYKIAMTPPMMPVVLVADGTSCRKTPIPDGAAAAAFPS